MCTQPLIIHKRNVSTGQVEKRVVPCGKCKECLISKQTESAVLSYMEAVKRGKLVFTTLTYNNETFPMRFRKLRPIGDSGEFELVNLDFVPEVRCKSLRDEYIDFAGADFSKIRTDVVDGSSDIVEVCPSLRRKDFRDYIKRERLAYERRHGVKIPEFSYQMVGEYGEQNHRPHYHVLFYGLDIKIVYEILQSWTEDYGYIDVKEVKQFPANGIFDGFLAVSRYLGKYVTKGYDDCPTVLAGIAEKSRILRSIGFGIPQPKTLASLLGLSMLRILLAFDNALTR